MRSLWHAVRIPDAPEPFDTAVLKVHYPALVTGSDEERLSGNFRADPANAPYPVVLILSGINVGQDAYRWLATDLASRGFAAVTYDWVGPLFAGQVGLTPGVDLALAKPDTYGQGPTCQAIAPIISALSGLLDGALDTTRLALVGHSAGGTVALQSGRFFSGVRAVATYGAHTMVSTMLGWPAGTIAPAHVESPVLLLAGTEDGVIADSADRYQATGDHDPVSRTFDEALQDRGGEHVLAWLQGGNHFSIADPVDPTSARAFLDRPSTVDGASARAAIAGLLATFLGTHLRGEPAAEADESLLKIRRR
ncbi:dienelactone hydrolase family protein [Dactylosporangium sp. AC04546]|uniref:alpha/beta hydrolase family protein n=1 Tax=Dactylosporangium sp. AC04546 TaxID=2862460 RepID=UPI001EDCF631|nr:dienelactone hydrolase family protein [Dactylosporangium sp. AC04546]WVK81473.1 dienelactone hydrolase family protein [Dactylosporangium sp. AC04546]